jgi:hypothetical protein
MPHEIMFQPLETFVVLETNQPEQFLSAAELLAKLKIALQNLPGQMPPDLQKFSDLETQAQYLLDTACELDLGSDQYLQWYAVRLEK